MSSIKVEAIPGQVSDQNPAYKIIGDPINNFILRITNYLYGGFSITVFDPDQNPSTRAIIISAANIPRQSFYGL